MLGGAPFNVAWNLKGLGRAPTLVSAIGDDDRGSEIRTRMRQHGLDLSGLQINDHPTGQVNVSFEFGQPEYEIAVDQAFDFLKADLASLSDETFSVIYHGSLIWRSPESRQAVQELRSHGDANVFVDLNIRQPWFQSDQVNEILVAAQSLKLNSDELSEMTGLAANSDEEIRRAAWQLLSVDAYTINSLWVTVGDRGAFHFGSNGSSEFSAAPKVDDLVDPVGAGDAFSAAVIDGMMRGEIPKQILANAVRFAAKVCQLQGATTTDRSFYKRE